MMPADLLSACALDAVLGDPRWIPHPVRMMGYVSTLFEHHVRRLFDRPRALRAAGILLAVGLPTFAALSGWILIAAATGIHEWLGRGVGLWLASTTLAWRDLMDHVGAVGAALRAGSLTKGREAVSHIVGRDTATLSEPEVVRATIETAAESASDGIIAPLLYLAIGGVPLALAFKAVSTLDSLVGHRDERYRDFGWASARLDDLFNWIPARLTAWLTVFAAGLVLRSWESAKRSAAILLRDGHKHLSPNSGRPEAAMAGALGVQLGGVNFYDGQKIESPRLGDAVYELSRRRIEQAQSIMTVSYFLAIAGIVGCLWW